MTLPTANLPETPTMAPPTDKLLATRFDWLCAASTQPGKATQLALLLAWLASRRASPTVSPSRRAMRRFGLSRDACYDGLRRLQDARLVYSQSVNRLVGARRRPITTDEPKTHRRPIQRR